MSWFNALVVASTTAAVAFFGALPVGAEETDADGASVSGELYGCDRTIDRPPRGDLHKVTDPPDGSIVVPGQKVTVTITWDVADWEDTALHKVLDCVAIDGTIVPDLQGGESPTDNDGTFVHEFTVPDDVPDGAQICDQAMLSGPGPEGPFHRDISRRLCLTTSTDTTRSAPPDAPVALPPPPAPPPPAPPVDAPPERQAESVPPKVEGEQEVKVPAADTPPAPAPAAAPAPAPALPRTGAAERLLLALAGALLWLGGLAVMGAAGRRSRPAPTR